MYACRHALTHAQHAHAGEVFVAVQGMKPSPSLAEIAEDEDTGGEASVGERRREEVAVASSAAVEIGEA